MTHPKQHVLVSRLLTLSAVLGGLSISAHAATFYVSKASGASDSYTVAQAKDTPGKPYLTITKALQMANDNPSSTVNVILVEPGTYPENFTIRQSGLTLKARNNANYSASRSILKPVGSGIWNVVNIEASSVTLLGFEIDGSQANVDGTQENGDEGASTNGVYIAGDHANWNNTATIPAARHVRVAACVIHDNGGVGVCSNGPNELTVATLDSVPAGGSDYITIEDNLIYNNCYWSRWAASGISLHNVTSADNGAGPHNIIRRNAVYKNTAKYTKPDKPNGNTYHSDGNGIIVDYNGNKNPLTLIENNLVYLNGGRGIHIFQSSNVIVRNNSTYNNNQDPDVNSRGGGELTAINSKNVQFFNNVSSGFAPNFCVQSLWGYPAVSNVTIRACTYYGGTPIVPDWGVVDWSTTFHGDPYYYMPESGNLYPVPVPTQPNKTAAQSQTVIDRASSIAGDYADDDYYLGSRPQGAGRDRGAIERSLPPAPLKAARSSNRS